MTSPYQDDAQFICIYVFSLLTPPATEILEVYRTIFVGVGVNKRIYVINCS